MRVLFIYRYGILGGVCTQLFNRALALPNYEIDFLFRFDHGASKLLAEFGNVFVNSSPAYLKELLQKGYDGVFLIDSPEYLPYIDDSNNLFFEVHTSIKRNFEHLKQCPDFIHDSILVPSFYMKRLLSKEIEPKLRHIEVLPNVFLPQSKSNVAAIDFSYVRNWVGKAKPLLWIGKIDDHKGWQSFLAHLRRVEGDVKGIMVGGITAPKEMLVSFLARVCELGLEDSLLWLSHVEYAHMESLYSCVRSKGGVYTVTSKDESFSMTTLEAAYYGVKVASNGIDVVNEVTSGLRGVYTKDDCANGAKNLSSALNSIPLESEEIIANQRVISENYGAKTFYGKFTKLLSKV